MLIQEKTFHGSFKPLYCVYNFNLLLSTLTPYTFRCVAPGITLLPRFQFTPHLVPFPLSKASSGKVTGFPYWSPQALPVASCSLSPAPPTALSRATPWQGSALAGPSPCLHGNQEGCGCGPCTHMNAEVTPVNRESTIHVCEDIPIAGTTGSGCSLLLGKHLPYQGMLVKPVSEHV